MEINFSHSEFLAPLMTQLLLANLDSANIQRVAVALDCAIAFGAAHGEKKLGFDAITPGELRAELDRKIARISEGLPNG